MSRSIDTYGPSYNFIRDFIKGNKKKEYGNYYTKRFENCSFLLRYTSDDGTKLLIGIIEGNGNRIILRNSDVYGFAHVLSLRRL